MKKILGIILARAGSKGIKNKNIKKLGGIPLLEWTINSALKSRMLTKTILSTDSKKMSALGKKLGVDVPFLRPTRFSKDKSSSIDAIEHAINFLSKNEEIYDYVLLLEPTSPFRTYKDIDSSIKKILASSAESLISICKLDSFNPSFVYTKKAKNFLQPIKKISKKYLRRQDIEPTYFIEGSIYISKISTLLKKRSFSHKKTIGYEVPKWKSIEIDDSLDLILAEAIMKKIIKKN